MLSFLPQRARVALLVTFIAVAACAPDARAQASEASALSLLPVAVVSAAPVALFASGVTLTVVGVEASAQGVVWVLERASDGARATLKLAGQASVAVGTAVTVTAMSAGWVLSAAGQAIACIPNEVGASLLYNERVTR
jgi:hypothetical protein